MPSAVAVCNLALSRIGVAPIASLEGTNLESRSCNTVYQASVDALLESFEWPWATKRAVLPPLLQQAPGGWANSFLLPSDCLALRDVAPDAGAGEPLAYGVPVPLVGYSEAGGYPGREPQSATQRMPFQVEATAAGAKVLLCDSANPTVRYTARVDASRFPPLFVQALAWHLASELALALAKKPDMHSRAISMFESAWGRATASSASEGQADRPQQSPYITARGG